MKLNKLFFLSIFISFFLSGCFSLRTTAKDEKHQMELTVHEVQTNLDDLKHDFTCYQTELQILDNKIKHHENSLTTIKQNYVEHQQNKNDQLLKTLQNLEKKIQIIENKQTSVEKDLRSISSHANETSGALSQYKQTIQNLEKEIISQQHKMQEINDLKLLIKELTGFLKEDNSTEYKIYRVKPKDSLEKIAKAHHISVELIKKINHLQEDLIVIGQELKIPLN